jgi:hypothetical protein
VVVVAGSEVESESVVEGVDCEVDSDSVGDGVGSEVVGLLQFRKPRGKYKFQPVFGVMMLSVHEVDIWQPPLTPNSKEVHVESATQS